MEQKTKPNYILCSIDSFISRETEIESKWMEKIYQDNTNCSILSWSSYCNNGADFRASQIIRDKGEHNIMIGQFSKN